MASTLVLLLQLLLVSLVSASHYFGGTTNFAYKGRNADGTWRVVIKDRDTFDGCQYSLYWSCHGSNCGHRSTSVKSILDRSTSAPVSNREWCETETVYSMDVRNNKPFERRAASCCWIPTRRRYYSNWWRLSNSIDLGERSDTGEPNRSPDTAILPFLRVPKNCPRTYKLLSFDPDGDRVKCRYGSVRNVECYDCLSHHGFHLDESSCTLHYHYTTDSPYVHAFELMVEDYPQRDVTLTYTDGSHSLRSPLTERRSSRRKRAAYHGYTTTPWWWWHTSTTTPPYTTTTAAPTTTTQHPTTTTPYPTTPWWWWHTSTTTPPYTTTTAATTTTPYPTTTAAPTTTTQHPTTTTPYPTTPWWWWWHHPINTSFLPYTTTTAAPTTTTPYPTTTTPYPTTTWGWRYTSRPLIATTPPLSKLPLQFSFLVDPPAPSCIEGEYLPRFVAPTPANGARIQAEINREVSIRIKARASYATIQDMIISGPTNVTKHRTTHNEFVIRWTPTQSDLGDYVPFCFVVEAATGSGVTSFPWNTHSHSHSHSHVTPTSQSGVYQSEMRCVVVEVREAMVNTNVICTPSTMRVEVEKSCFRGLHEDHLRLNDPSNTVCSLYSNGTHFIGDFPLNACGTQIEEDDENLLFKNEITTVDDSSDLITRKHLLEVEFYCQYPKKGNVTLGFSAHRKNVTVSDKGFGKFTYQFEFYPNNQFRTMIDPSSYPLMYDVGDKIYMEIDASSTVNNTELFVESCRASPYDNPNYHPTYSIIENGCPVDPTVMTHETNDKRQFRFCIQAFKFIGLHDQVYISCSVLVCEAGNPDSRCAQGCINDTSSNGHQHSHRRKRGDAIQTPAHFISQGPLRLKRSADIDTRTGLNLNPTLNLNLVFIAGCLLAIVGMICGVVMYKTKASRVKYQPLPSYEN
ncbi:uncharacterized protein KZ484_022334 [Pholidichthys leucotaenia]